MATSRLCSIDGCGKRVLARWCTEALSAMAQRGDPPMPASCSSSVPATFFKNTVLPYRVDDCSIWPRQLNRKRLYTNPSIVSQWYSHGWPTNL